MTRPTAGEVRGLLTETPAGPYTVRTYLRPHDRACACIEDAHGRTVAVELEPWRSRLGAPVPAFPLLASAPTLATLVLAMTDAARIPDDADPVDAIAELRERAERAERERDEAQSRDAATRDLVATMLRTLRRWDGTATAVDVTVWTAEARRLGLLDEVPR